MTRRDLFDLKSQFPNVNSLALVGNAPSALHGKRGKQIDGHDLVVRFNRATTRGFESAIGERTDILISNELNHLGRSPAPANVLQVKSVLCFVHPSTIAKLDIQAFRDWVGDIPYCISFAPDVVQLPTGDRIRQLTMGNYALYTLCQMFPIERLMLTGFTMFGAVAGGASTYFSKHKEDFAQSVWHDLDIEAQVMAALLKRFDGELFVSAEVQALMDKYEPVSRGNSITSLAPRRVLARLGWLSLRLGIYLRRITEQT